MENAIETSQAADDTGIILVQAEDAYWLLDGESHMSALLSGKAHYPTPVRMVAFDDLMALHAFLTTKNHQLASLWAVHPGIVDRLREDDELVTLTAPRAA
ncbi:hypothetical protein DS901_18320 [Loktanella sp. D2R18]|uniref:hypothetical protein n=1 Tax=Rhodobacterales TaxID=204455 RepID=UPI000DE83D6E|nr:MULTISPECIES: hypothetical protein [Rhodobacterales]MDO6590549.1 hypothetical protein [Yoonia sp. 1_MG-2023]RBW41265.1 hypothetical protein DS901_18320 [Loktanella sp. D2R18]